MQAPLCSLPSLDTGCRERPAIASRARPLVVLDVVILPEVLRARHNDRNRANHVFANEDQTMNASTTVRRTQDHNSFASRRLTANLSRRSDGRWEPLTETHAAR